LKLAILQGSTVYGAAERVPSGRTSELILATVGFLGRPAPTRCPNLRLHALTTAPAVGALIADPGSRSSTYAELSRALGLQEGASFAGRMYTDAFTREVDVLVQPSRVDAIPLTTPGAIHRGSPVIVTDVGGVRGILEDGCGLIVAPEDSAALAPDSRTRYGRGSQTASGGTRARAARARYEAARNGERVPACARTQYKSRSAMIQVRAVGCDAADRADDCPADVIDRVAGMAARR
jgi:glycosyltransferase involved in cell wall biosynthesis